MELNAEARRILAVSISKVYASRSQRGGLRLHRSLLVSLVMKSARDIYHSSAALLQRAAPSPEDKAMDITEDRAEDRGMDRAEDRKTETPREDKENQSPAEVKRPRKRPGKVSAVPDFLPEKRARLEPGEERHGAARHGPAQSACRGNARTDSLCALPLLHRAIPAF